MTNNQHQRKHVKRQTTHNTHVSNRSHRPGDFVIAQVSAPPGLASQDGRSKTNDVCQSNDEGASKQEVQRRLITAKIPAAPNGCGLDRRERVAKMGGPVFFVGALFSFGSTVPVILAKQRFYPS